MGKNNPEPRRDRREPFNQPIKIYEVSRPEGRSDLRKVMDEIDRGLHDPCLGETIDARVGKIIGIKRAKLGLSSGQFARSMKMPAARLKKIEAGEEMLTLSLLERIASALGCSLSVELV